MSDKDFDVISDGVMRAQALAAPVTENYPTLEVNDENSTMKFSETYTGARVTPLALKLEQINIIDIAHALSQQCRYGGHTSQFYSVAQHCCVLASYVENVLKGKALDCLQILMHDAAEAYLIDMPRPIKQFMPEFRKWDHAAQAAIRSWLGIGDVPIPSWQGDLDNRIIVDERAQVMSDSGNDWHHDPKHGVMPLGVRIEPWPARMAEKQFLFRYAAYMNGVYGQHAYLDEAWNVFGGSNLKAHLGTSSDHPTIEDLIEVDLRGGVGRVKLRSENGMLERDPQAGMFPRPAWKWVHGDFSLVEPAEVKVTTNGI
jgi:hypothetical protein